MDFRAFVRFEPRDLWVGAYWNPEHAKDAVDLPAHSYSIVTRRVYVCLVPMVPIVFEWKHVRR